MVYEPLHPNCPPGFPYKHRPKNFFVSLQADKVLSDEFLMELRPLFESGKAPFWHASNGIKAQLSIIKRKLGLAVAHAKGKQVLFKSPESYFVAEQLHSAFKTKNVVLLRHPVRFVASCKRLHWNFNVRLLAELEYSLCPDCRQAYRDTNLTTYEDNEINNNARLWRLGAHHFNCLHHKFSENIDWVFIYHESLLSEGIPQLKSIHRRLNLEWCIEVENRFERTRTPDPTTNYQVDQQHRPIRAPHDVLNGWKNQLNTNEAGRVIEICGDLAHKHFPEFSLRS